MKIKVLKKQNNSDKCVVCGTSNRLGINARFYELEGALVAAICTPQDEHQSYPGHMHGGMICALLDETAGRALQIEDENLWAVTAEINVKYKKPVPLGEKILCVGKVIKKSGRIVKANAYIENSCGDILAWSEGVYIICPIDKIAGDFLNGDHWFNIGNEEDPTSVDVLNPTFFEKYEEKRN